MKVELERASKFSHELPDSLAIQETLKYQYSWYKEDPSERFGAQDMRKGWFIEIPNFDFAVEKWGDIVIRKSDFIGIPYKITIYDDYIE